MAQGRQTPAREVGVPLVDLPGEAGFDLLTDH